MENEIEIIKRRMSDLWKSILIDSKGCDCDTCQLFRMWQDNSAELKRLEERERLEAERITQERQTEIEQRRIGQDD